MTSLEDEVDTMQQPKLYNKLLISGPAVKKLLSNSSEVRKRNRNLGIHSLRSLRLLVGSLTIGRSQMADPVVQPAVHLAFDPAVDPGIRQPTGEQGTPPTRSQESELASPDAAAAAEAAIINDVSRGVLVSDAEIDPAVIQSVLS